MAIVEQIKCNGCGIIKGETNHWYMVYIGGSHGPTWQIFPWDSLAARGEKKDELKHVCGQQCAHKLLDEFLQHSIKTS